MRAKLVYAGNNKFFAEVTSSKPNVRIDLDIKKDDIKDMAIAFGIIDVNEKSNKELKEENQKLRNIIFEAHNSLTKAIDFGVKG